MKKVIGRVLFFGTLIVLACVSLKLVADSLGGLLTTEHFDPPKKVTGATYVFAQQTKVSPAPKDTTDTTKMSPCPGYDLHSIGLTNTPTVFDASEKVLPSVCASYNAYVLELSDEHIAVLDRQRRKEDAELLKVEHPFHR
jgi:hypothetical protein